MNRNIRLFYVHNFLTDFQFHAAFLVIFFAQITGSYAQAMIVLSVLTISSALLEIPTGILSDKIGRKWTIVLGSLFSSLGVFCYAAAHDAPLLYLGAFLNGLSCCLFSGNNDALLFETLKSEGKENKFHHYLGKTNSMFQLALATSALTSSVIVDQGLRLVFMLGVVPQIMALFVSLFFFEPRIHEKEKQHSLSHLITSIKIIRRNPRLLLLMFAQAISHGANESNFQFKTVFVEKLWPIWAVGLYRSLNHGLSFFGFWFSGSLIDRFKESRLLIFREFYWFTSQIIAVFIANVISPLLILSGAFLFGPGNVARDHLLQKEFTNEQRATMGSVVSFTGSVVFAIVSVGIGLVADQFGVNSAVGFGVVICALSLPLYIKLFRSV